MLDDILQFPSTKIVISLYHYLLKL